MFALTKTHTHTHTHSPWTAAYYPLGPSPPHACLIQHWRACIPLSLGRIAGACNWLWGSGQMCSNWEVFELKGVQIKRYHCTNILSCLIDHFSLNRFFPILLNLSYNYAKPQMKHYICGEVQQIKKRNITNKQQMMKNLYVNLTRMHRRHCNYLCSTTKVEIQGWASSFSSIPSLGDWRIGDFSGEDTKPAILYMAIRRDPKNRTCHLGGKFSKKW